MKTDPRIALVQRRLAGVTLGARTGKGRSVPLIPKSRQSRRVQSSLWEHSGGRRFQKPVACS